MGGIACDNNFSQVSLLLTCDGNNGGTTFTDSSQNAIAQSSVTTTSIDTAAPKFGTGAMNFGVGTGSQVLYPMAAGGPLDLRGGDFTIEMWVKPAQAQSASKALLSENVNPPQINLLWNSGTPGFQFNFKTTVASLSCGNAPFTIVAGVWTHLAVVLSGTAVTLYVNGVAQTGVASTAGNPLIAPTAALVFGSSAGSGQNWQGEIDDVRITKGLARYTSNFTPTGPNPAAACFPIVPNVVGLTRTAAIALLTADGFKYTITEVNQTHPTVPVGSVVSQLPATGTSYLHIGDNVTISISTGPLLTAGTGGDVWGTTGGSNDVNGTPPQIGQTLAYAQHKANAIVQGNQSVLSALSTGAQISQGAAIVPVAPIIQATPDTSVPTTPQVGS